VTHARTQNGYAAQAGRSDGTATVMSLVLALAYGGGWWLEHAHWLMSDPHAHGQIPPSWYQLGDALQLIRVGVPIAAAVSLLASLEWPARRKEATPW
jgi:hypothetical protein